MYPYLPLLGTAGIPDRVLGEAATPLAAIVLLAALALAALVGARCSGDPGRGAGHLRP